MEDEKPEESESDNSAKEGTNESEVEVKEEDTTQAVEVTSETPRGLGDLLPLKINSMIEFNSKIISSQVY